jgi:hypothetical protein
VRRSSPRRPSAEDDGRADPCPSWRGPLPRASRSTVSAPGSTVRDAVRLRPPARARPPAPTRPRSRPASSRGPGLRDDGAFAPGRPSPRPPAHPPRPLRPRWHRTPRRGSTRPWPRRAGPTARGPGRLDVGGDVRRVWPRPRRWAPPRSWTPRRAPSRRAAGRDRSRPRATRWRSRRLGRGLPGRDLPGGGGPPRAAGLRLRRPVASRSPRLPGLPLRGRAQRPPWPCRRSCSLPSCPREGRGGPAGRGRRARRPGVGGGRFEPAGYRPATHRFAPARRRSGRRARAALPRARENPVPGGHAGRGSPGMGPGAGGAGASPLRPRRAVSRPRWSRARRESSGAKDSNRRLPSPHPEVLDRRGHSGVGPSTHGKRTPA